MAFESIWIKLVHWTVALGMGGNSMPQGELPFGVEWDPTGQYRYSLNYEGKKYPFNLIDPEEAPKSEVEEIMLGYRIFLDPKKYAPEYTRAAISCNNCHFSGGNSLGGLNAGISLLGVTSTYPRYIERFKKYITIQERIQSCFIRSLNGKPPPVESKVMKSLVAYLLWISSEVDPLPVKPWLGLKALPTDLIGDPLKGKKEYMDNCSACHRSDGNGTVGAPPLWGDRSFNDDAGMNKLSTLSAFIKLNMPHNQPSLTDQQAVNIATFIKEQPRPQFKDK